MDGMPFSQPRRSRMHVLFVGFIGFLLLGLVALNAPLTFAQSSTSPSTSQTRSTYSSSGLATTSSSAVLLDATVEDVAKSANPAVVTITNLQTSTNPRTGAASRLQPVDSGSGYIISADGYVVTNNHVTTGGQSFQVQFMDGTTFDATLVGSDAVQDVAVLKLDLKVGQKVPGVLAFGDSSTVVAGQQVVAIGTPYGQYTNSVSTGIVNAINRSLNEGNGLSLPNLIQHDAPIYPGNSGGPLRRQRNRRHHHQDRFVSPGVHRHPEPARG
jgi:S1-C subfamily serine protease